MGFPSYKISQYLYDNLPEVLRENGLPVSEIPVPPPPEIPGFPAGAFDDSVQTRCDILTVIGGQEVKISRDWDVKENDFRAYAFLARNDKFLPKKLRLELFNILERYGAVMQI